MFDFLSKIGNFFKNVFSANTAAALFKGVKAAAPYVNAALQMAAMVSKFTPEGGKTFGTVIRYAEALGITAVFEGEVTEQSVGTALRDITVKALRAKFPEASTSDLNRAVELAVGAIKWQ